MDNKKAIALLSMIEFEHAECCLNTWYKGIDDDMKEALNMAIQALKQEPCEDAISRSDAIRVASGYCHWSNIPKELAKLPSVNPIPCDDVISRQAALDIVNSYSESQSNVEDVTQDIISDIVVLPSVSTEKTGHWRHYEGMLICSECGAEFYDDIMEYCGDDVPKCCPDCGTKMEVEE